MLAFGEGNPNARFLVFYLSVILPAQYKKNIVFATFIRLCCVSTVVIWNKGEVSYT